MRLALLLALGLVLSGAVAPAASARHACHPELGVLCAHPEEVLVPLLCKVLGPFLPLEGCN